MCGIAGFLGYGGLYADDIQAVAKRMGDAIRHRGPDDSGVWCNDAEQVVLVHRRLSIIDLSPAGHQPMVSASGRYVIVFNGEIYNHLKIRRELETASPQFFSREDGQYLWQGHSDTETLLMGIDAWGLEAMLKRVIGMFALALWDRQARTFYLARDRFGEKPLYYGWQGKGDGRVFLFGSELKALKAHPVFSAGIERGALCLLLRHNYIPAPYSIYQNIAKLEPGSLLSVSWDQPEPRIRKYWDAAAVVRSGLAQPFEGTAGEAVDLLEVLLTDAVRQQMMADVPLGAFLSGGVDSSLIVALMQAQSVRPVKTFTIGFNEGSYNEAVYAKAVAAHLGTEHTELYVTPEQAMAVIPLLPLLYNEPFSDSSQIPTFLVSQLARQHVTVSLSGDAGDELFCGYNRYQLTAKLWRIIRAFPSLLRRSLGRGITSISPETWRKLAERIPIAGRFNNFADKLHKGAGILGSESVDELYLGLVSHWGDPALVVIRGKELPTFLGGNAPAFAELDVVPRMMALDMLTYLPDDILTKVDRAAMGVSLESRIPFLEHRVVEFAWRLPQAYKLRGGQTKWVLRQVLYRYVPQSLIERPKMGFGVPIGSWLRGPLRDWAEDLLDERRLLREGYFYTAPIRQKWDEHLSGKRNWQYHLWDVLMFQAWLTNQNG